MKIHHPLRVPMLISNYVKLYCKGIEKTLPDLDRRYVIYLGGQHNYIFPYLLPLNILFNPTIQVCTSILVHPILVYSEEHVIFCCEAISGEVALDR